MASEIVSAIVNCLDNTMSYYFLPITRTSWPSPTMSPTLQQTLLTRPGMGDRTTLLTSTFGFSGMRAMYLSALAVRTVMGKAVPLYLIRSPPLGCLLISCTICFSEPTNVSMIGAAKLKSSLRLSSWPSTVVWKQTIEIMNSYHHGLCIHFNLL